MPRDLLPVWLHREQSRTKNYQGHTTGDTSFQLGPYSIQGEGAGKPQVDAQNLPAFPKVCGGTVAKQRQSISRWR